MDNEQDLAVCKICGIKRNDLKPHINKVHKLTTEEYKKLFGENVKLISETTRKKYSERIKGEKNPGYKHNGRLSPFSKNFKKYENLLDEEKQQAINELNEKRVESTFNGNGFNVTLDYWIKKCNGDVDRAKLLYKDRQTTFSLQKCIEKHGLDIGFDIWNERQEKWLKTIFDKTNEELFKKSWMYYW